MGAPHAVLPRRRRRRQPAAAAACCWPSCLACGLLPLLCADRSCSGGKQAAAACSPACSSAGPPPGAAQALYKPFTRLPATLLHDASPDGPLSVIAAACGEHMKAKGLKRIDWLAPNLRKEVRAAAVGWAAGGPGRWVWLHPTGPGAMLSQRKRQACWR